MKYTPVKSLKASNIESPCAKEKSTIIISVKEVNLSLLQNMQSPKRMKPKKIGVTPSKKLPTFPKEFLIIK